MNDTARKSYRFPPMDPEVRKKGREHAAEMIAKGEWGLFPCGEEDDMQDETNMESNSGNE